LNTTSGRVDLEEVNKSIAAQYRFQRRWQLLSMTFYVVATVGTLLSTSAAGLLAAMHYDLAAAILAGVSTVLVGTEKSLLFREKWRFHLTVRTKLELLQSAIVAQGLEAATAGKQFSEIMENYAVNLPVEARGNLGGSWRSSCLRIFPTAFSISSPTSITCRGAWWPPNLMARGLS
jgi:hypothetical protein